MKILHVAETIKGGIASVLSEIIPAQIKAFGQENVLVLIPANQASELPCITGAQCKTFIREKRNPAALWALTCTLYNILRKEQPDILHLHSSFAGFIGRLVALFVPKKPIVIYCAHGWAFTMQISAAKKACYALAERLLSFITDGIINISDFEARAAQRYGLPTAKMRTIYNGINPMMEQPPLKTRSANDKKKFLFVGRFDKQKGIDLLIRALQQIPNPDFIVQAVGEGVLESGTVSFPPCVEALGWRKREEMPALYFGADALIVPSRWEGFGLVAIEAMSCATPVLASKHGALSEIVTDAQTGILFDPTHTDDFARMLTDVTIPNLTQMGQNAAVDMRKRFTAQRMNDAVQAMYTECLTAKRAH